MKIAMLGSGSVGNKLGALLAAAGHEVVVGSRDPEAAQARLHDGLRAQSHLDAVNHGEVLLVATPWADDITLDLLTELRPFIGGKIVVDCTNPLAADWLSNSIGHTTSGGEEIAKVLPDARVVKAFNTIFAAIMEDGKQTFDGVAGTGFYCGDDDDAKAVVAGLIRDAGFDPVDVGVLKNARYLEPMAQLNIQIATLNGGDMDVAFHYMRR